MEFLIDYWYIILILFILILLIILVYLIVKEKRDRKDCLISDGDSFEIKLKKDEEKVIDVISNQDKNSIIQEVNEESLKEEVLEEVNIDENSKFDEDFSKVVPKKELFDDELKKSIDNIKLDPIEIKQPEDMIVDITLPEIEINKK